MWDHYKRNCVRRQVTQWNHDECFGKQFFVHWKLKLRTLYIFSQIWASAKILSTNFCSELFCQSFLPPKFCIVWYKVIYHLLNQIILYKSLNRTFTCSNVKSLMRKSIDELALQKFDEQTTNETVACATLGIEILCMENFNESPKIY